MKTPLLWGCLAVLGMLLAWLLWSDRDVLVTDQDSIPAQTREAGPESTKRKDTHAQWKDQAGAPVEDIRERVQATHAPSSMRIHVLYKVDRTPVAGAAVTVLDTQRMVELRKGLGWRLDADQRAATRRAATTEAITNSEGTVEIPRRAERYVVEATHGGLWGHLYVSARSKEPLEILLEKDHSLQVRVRSEATGQPVPGVPVWLRRFLVYGAPFEAAFERTRSPDGMATFHHVQQVLNRKGRWQVFLGVPQRKQSFAPVSMAELPTEPLELVVADAGTVIVRVQDETGAPVDGRKLSCQLSVFPTENRVKPMIVGSYWSHRPIDEHGVARLSPIGVGLFLRIKVSARDRSSLHRPVTVDLAGPARSGATVACDVLWGSPTSPETCYPLVTGRFVHNDGSPWRRAKLHVNPWIFPTPRRYPSSRNVELSAEGRFRLVLKEPCPAGGKRVYRFRTDSPGRSGVLEARVDLSRRFPSGETDIGDVVLDHGELLVSGRVVDAAGQALPKARLRVTQLVITKDKEYWPGVDCVGGHANAEDGSFALHAIPGMDLPTGRLRLKVTCPGLLPAEPIEFAIGTKGLRIVLHSGGAVEGSVRLAPGQVAEEIGVMVCIDGVARSTSLRKDGSFHRGGLPAGVARLVAWSRAGHQGEATRVEIENLVIQPGVTNRDPRIQGIVVADRRSGSRVEVYGEGGEPVFQALVRRLDGKAGAVIYADHRGHCVLKAEKFPVEVAVSGFGYAEKKVSLQAGRNRVILARGLTIQLHTEAKTIGKDPDYHLGFMIYHVDPQLPAAFRHVYGGAFPYDRRYFDASGRASIPVPGPGTYEVQPWVFIRGKDNIGRGGGLPMRSFPRIRVVAKERSQRFRIHIPAGVLADAVRRFAQ